MSPADVWAGSLDAAAGAGTLRFWRNVRVYDAPLAQAMPAGAALLGTSRADGVLTLSFSVPLPAGAEALNVNWAVGEGSAERMRQHGSTAGAHFGAAQVNLLCVGGAGCVLRADAAPLRSWARLHAVAGGGFCTSVAAAAALRACANACGGVLRAGVHAPLLRGLRRLPGRPFANAQNWAQNWAAPELLLACGYFATLAAYLRAAAQLYPASYGHALGTLLAPAWAVALLPTARSSLLLHLLGASHERAAAVHRAATLLALALTSAHVARTAQERGARSLADTAQNASSYGNAFGTAAASAMAAMAVLACGPVRRASFTLFKASHVALFPVALLLACLHAQHMIAYVLPPLLLWGLDRARTAARGPRRAAGAPTRRASRRCLAAPCASTSPSRAASRWRPASGRQSTCRSWRRLSGTLSAAPAAATGRPCRSSPSSYEATAALAASQCACTRWCRPAPHASR